MGKKTHCLHPMSVGHARKSTCTLPWPLCCRCGLLVLKNEVSQQALKAPCPGRE